MKEHAEDRKLRLAAQAEARSTIGPFWRKNWRKFVALVSTYADHLADKKMMDLRDEFWGNTQKKGEPPKGAR